MTSAKKRSGLLDENLNGVRMETDDNSNRGNKGDNSKAKPGKSVYIFVDLIEEYIYV